jgi:hypothetical protein
VSIQGLIQVTGSIKINLNIHCMIIITLVLLLIQLMDWWSQILRMFKIWVSWRYNRNWLNWRNWQTQQNLLEITCRAARYVYPTSGQLQECLPVLSSLFLKHASWQLVK